MTASESRLPIWSIIGLVALVVLAITIVNF